VVAAEDAVEAQEERKKENLNRVKNAAKQCVNAAKDAAKDAVNFIKF
jgi:hypothetical protein